MALQDCLQARKDMPLVDEERTIATYNVSYKLCARIASLVVIRFGVVTLSLLT